MARRAQSAKQIPPQKLPTEVSKYLGIEKEDAIESAAYRGLKHKMETTDWSLHRKAGAHFSPPLREVGFTSANSFLSAAHRDSLSRSADWDQSAKRAQNVISPPEIVPSEPLRLPNSPPHSHPAVATAALD